MAYADQEGMSTNRLVSVIIVLLLHAFLGYALVTGLAFEAVQKVKEKLNVIDVKEEEPPEEEELPPPPEPEKQIEPPVVVPPPIVPTVPRPPTVPTVPKPPPSAPVVPTAAPPAPAAPPPSKRPNPVPRGNPGNWANTNDYPSRALQQEREGTTGFRVTVDERGRVTDCVITSSSGHNDLDDATCKNITRRARFQPALDSAGNAVSGTWPSRVRWEIPK